MREAINGGGYQCGRISMREAINAGGHQCGEATNAEIAATDWLLFALRVFIPTW